MPDTLSSPPSVSRSGTDSRYEETRKRHQVDFFGAISSHFDRLGWTAEQLRDGRERRLRALLAVARERSPWHRDRLARIDLRTCTETDLAGLPVMTKDDLMANFDRIVTDARVTLDLVNRHLDRLASDAYLLDEHHAIASGGSSGRRGVFAYDWNGWGDWGLSCVRYLFRLQQQVPPSARGLTAVVMAGVATHGSSACPQTFRDMFGGDPPVLIPSTLGSEEIVRRLNATAPQMLMAYPSILAQLVSAARAGTLRIAPKLLVTTAEPLLPEIRAAALEQWPGALINFWGTSEAGAIASGCGVGEGMHLSDDLVIVEPVDIAGRPVEPGVRAAKVYLTNLFNHLLPLIRYELTDEVTLSTRSCPCGSAHRLVEDIQGRLDDTFVYPGVEPIHPLTFRSVLGRSASIVEYQVRQTPAGAEIHIVRDGILDAAAVARSIETGLARAGLEGAQVTLREVSQIPRPPSGKLKRFVPLPV